MTALEQEPSCLGGRRCPVVDLVGSVAAYAFFGIRTDHGVDRAYMCWWARNLLSVGSCQIDALTVPMRAAGLLQRCQCCWVDAVNRSCQTVRQSHVSDALGCVRRCFPASPAEAADLGSSLFTFIHHFINSGWLLAGLVCENRGFLLQRHSDHRSACSARRSGWILGGARVRHPRISVQRRPWRGV